MRIAFIITAIILAILSMFMGRTDNPAIRGLRGEKISEVYGIKPIGAEGFTLTDVNNKKVSDASFRGKQMLVYFGFTNCPMICPTDMKYISDVLEKLGDKKSQIATIFITVDPERDTPEQIKTFLSNFDSSIIGLTGTVEEIKKVQDSYKVYSAKTEEKITNGYNVDHSAFIYLMDEQGKYKAHFNGKTKIEEIIKAVEGKK
jgi:cytochrome oxidase Cu insertion factor (SCO1/SenC/PrrC family)